MMQIHDINTELFCVSCRINFINNSDYKDHFKCDWHRYNIKRKLVKLLPISLEQFQSKRKLEQNNQIQAYYCQQCRKKFNSQNTLKQHLNSKGHNPKNTKKIIHKNMKKQHQSYKQNILKCLFCNNIEQNLQNNLKHMCIKHSFFISEQQFCSNKSGLIGYMHDKIQIGNLCIQCDNHGVKDFHKAQAVRQHMKDKSHFFMKTDNGFQEYQQYYDFSSKFDDKLIQQQQNIIPFGIQYQKVKVYSNNNHDKKSEQQKDKQIKQHKNIHQKQQQNQYQEDNNSSSNEWSDCSESENDIKQETKQQIVCLQTLNKKKKNTKIDTYKIMIPTLTRNNELLLPNGKILGHRKYRYLYRQRYILHNWLNTQSKQLMAEKNNSHIALQNQTKNTLYNRKSIMQKWENKHINFYQQNKVKKNMLKLGMQNNNLMHFFRTQNSL